MDTALLVLPAERTLQRAALPEHSVGRLPWSTWEVVVEGVSSARKAVPGAVCNPQLRSHFYTLCAKLFFWAVVPSDLP